MEPRATRLEVRVTPGARRTGISGRHGDAWKISVTAPPDRGRANTALVTLLADELGVSSSSVRVLAGHTARRKIIEIDGLDPSSVARLLAASDKGAPR